MPSASAISAAERFRPSSSIRFHRCALRAASWLGRCRASLSCRFPHPQFLNQRLQPFCAQADVQAASQQIDPFHQHPDNARVLGREQPVPSS
jgi:hypothetical protein